MKNLIIPILCLTSIIFYQCKKDEDPSASTTQIAPKDLTATADDEDGVISLSWNYDDSSSTDKKISIFRSTEENGDYSELAKLPHFWAPRVTNLYEDSKAVPGVVYYYKVKAWTLQAGYTDPSNTVSTSLTKGIKPISTIGKAGPGTGEFQFESGWSMAHDGNYLYVADSKNYRLQRFNPDKTFKDWIGYNGAAWGAYTTNIASSPNFKPYRVVCRGGYTYVECYKDNKTKIIKLAANGTIVSEIADYPGSSSLNFAVDNNDKIFIWSSDYIYKVDMSSGNLIKKFGGFGSADGKFFSRSSNICVDQNNNLFVTDMGNKRIQKFDNEGNFIKKINVDVYSGHSNICYYNNHIYLVAKIYLAKYDLMGTLVDKWDRRSDPQKYLFSDEQIMINENILYNQRSNQILLHSLE